MWRRCAIWPPRASRSTDGQRWRRSTSRVRIFRPRTARAGRIREEWVRPPDFDEFQRLQDAAQGHVRLVTLSPEWPDAPHYIEQHHRARRSRVDRPHACHTAADSRCDRGRRDDVDASRQWSRQHHSHRGIHHLAAWPKTRLAASFIVDGHHLPDEFLRRAFAAKGADRSILVTDAAAPAMCTPGPYHAGRSRVELRDDGRVTLRGGNRLAGSSLRMDRAIGNVMRSRWGESRRMR